MSRNIIAMGERFLQGDYGTVRAAGELKVQESTIRRLTVAGEARITKSSVRRIKLAGELVADTLEFLILGAAGSVKLQGICKGGVCTVTGSLAAEFLDCKVLCNGGGSKKAKSYGNDGWSGVFHAVTFENERGLTLDFEYRFQNMISTESLNSNHEIECENFYSLADLTAETINADRIFLLNTGDVQVGQLTGTSVKIQDSFTPDKQFRQLPKSLLYKRRKAEHNMAIVPVIEADDIDIKGTKAELVSGQKVTIGDLCIIERAEYRESIKISEKAVVNEVIKI